MKPRGVIGVVASAGGVEALQELVKHLRADLPATILVVLHISPTGPSVLPQILSRAGNLPARHPVDGEELPSGVILVAPPDRHVTVSDGCVAVSRGPRESGHRPSGDTLLRSIAHNAGHRGAGIVLSGTMDDGAAGLRALRMVGGLALVQSPEDAAFPSMPLAAMAEAEPQAVAQLKTLADILEEWIDELGDVELDER